MGRLSALNVACYTLQHPSTMKTSHLTAQLKTILVFCDDGLPGLHALTASSRTRNAHGSRATGADPFDVGSEAPRATAAPRSFATTFTTWPSTEAFPPSGTPTESPPGPQPSGPPFPTERALSDGRRPLRLQTLRR